MKLFSTEQVSKFHPDKYADQISDAIVSACLEQDPQSRVACEVMVKDKTIILGGGAFSGKDPSKVDRSAAYMARNMAVDIVKTFRTVKTCQIQLAYAIGVVEPISVNILTDGVNAPDNIYKYIKGKYRLTPTAITNELGLLYWDYEKVAEGCHFRFNYNWQFLSNSAKVVGINEIEL